MERFSKIPVQVQAGVRDVVVAFIDRSHVESDENVADGCKAIGGLTGGAWPQRPHGASCATASKSPDRSTPPAFRKRPAAP